MEEPKKPQVLPTVAIPHFQEGISLVFSKWWALQMAVQNEWGGHDSHTKSVNFSSDIFNFFYKPNRKEPIYIDDLEEELNVGLDSFNTTADDGSVEEVAVQLMDASDSDSGEDENDNSMGNDEASNMMVDTPESFLSTNSTETQKNNGRHQQMEEAEDGWTVVPSRKSKGRKN
ncbi:hypothetical protein SOVF_179760 [Spinacia oleracea]|nr:hypothetical protein SOVF_179760 [Spinacia oleracea]